MPEAQPESHFESLEQQAHAARFGMWVFLASELLLFGSLFALFVTYQAKFPGGFHLGIEHNTKVLGSVNTGVLLTSSYLIASAVHMMRKGSAAWAGVLAVGTIFLGLVFLGIKFTEYAHHFHEGIYPGGVGKFFEEHHERGLAEFWTLYFLMTGLHALHVTVGTVLIGTMATFIARDKITKEEPQRLEVAAIYWHLVDVIWIFLWPLFYLA